MKIFSHKVAQRHWSNVDYRKNMSVIGLVQPGGHKEIMAIGSYAQAENHLAEVAFVVREDFQGMGVASYLLKVLEHIAAENDYTGFTATVLAENVAMMRVFKKRYPNAAVHRQDGGEFGLQMDFADAVDPPVDPSPCACE